MKKLLLIFSVVLTFAISGNTVGLEGLTQYGVLMTDGGTTHTGIGFGGDILIKDLGDNIYLKERLVKFSVRNPQSDLQGEFALTMLQVIVAENIWNLYVTAKSGLFNQTVDGDDKISYVAGLEFGCSPLKKRIDLAVGFDVVPVFDRGDKIYLYGSFNIEL